MISVCIATYNRKEILMNHLYCLSEQTYEDFEVIVVSDGSTDGTSEMMKEFIHRTPYRLEFVEYPKRGYRLALARNVGIRATSGEIVVTMDDDMLPEPSYLQKMADRVKPGLVISTYNFALSAKLKVNKTILLAPVGYSTGYMRSDLERVGLFDENFTHWGHEDAELAHRLFNAGIEVEYHPDIVTLHYEKFSQADVEPYRTVEGASATSLYFKNKYKNSQFPVLIE